MEINDKIIFKFYGTTLEYEVASGLSGRFFLSILNKRLGYNNSTIFETLGIDDRYGFCEKVTGKSIKDNMSHFPELNSLEDLEKVVSALYQEIINKSVPKYKEGDIVKILPRQGAECDYPNSYIEDMEKYANGLYTIKRVSRYTVKQLKYYIKCEKYEEPFYYILNELGAYIWSSKMFSKVDIKIAADTGFININAIPNYIASDAFIAYNEKINKLKNEKDNSDSSEYKLNFNVKLLNFLKHD